MILNILLAQNPTAERFKSIRGGFNSRETIGADLSFFLWLMVLAAAFVAFLFIVARQRQKRGLNLSTAHPSRFFGRALRHLGVGFLDQKVIEYLARRAGIVHPAAMLIHHDVFKAYAGRIAGSIHMQPLRKYANGRLAMIHARLFEEGSGTQGSDSQP
ncbi:hypothetical protein B7486_00555 [cyanobacterium TDX16]|nr:hypothetical protein B7486_00555 [cyanobacterium TDX16]